MPQKYTSSVCDRSYSASYTTIVSAVRKDNDKGDTIKTISNVSAHSHSSNKIGESTASKLYDLLKK